MKYRIRITQIAVIVLIVIAKPHSWTLFVFGMATAFIGETIRFWSSGYLKKDKTLAGNGPYRMVRNPLYAGSFLMSVGFAVACANLNYPYRTAAFFAVVFLGFKFVYCIQVKAEEQHLEKIFGENYLRYKTKVNKYIPDLKLVPHALKDGNFSFALARKNREFTTLLGLILIAAVVVLKLHFKL
jgi:protein-S-isoprenylcysteine O-methyltransferase Ste14